jgi:adenylosuccinate synthase
VAARYAARLNTLTELVITKLDVLSQFERIKICVAYEFEGERHEVFPPNQTIFNKCTPVFEEVQGWTTDITAARSVADLPPAARNYVDRIEELADTPVSYVSVGPDREQMVSYGERSAGPVEAGAAR